MLRKARIAYLLPPHQPTPAAYPGDKGMQSPLTKSLTALSLFGLRAAYFVLRRQITRLGDYYADQQSGRNSGKSKFSAQVRHAGAGISGNSEVEFKLGAMSAAEPTSIKDVDGRTVRKGDIVRVLGIPDLSGMRDPYRAETHAVFKHIIGTRRKVYGFDQFGCAILVFGIRHGARAGSHSVAIEPHLIRKVIGNKVTPHGT
jgi:hypothetical protein